MILLIFIILKIIKFFTCVFLNPVVFDLVKTSCFNRRLKLGQSLINSLIYHNATNLFAFKNIWVGTFQAGPASHSLRPGIALSIVASWWSLLMIRTRLWKRSNSEYRSTSLCKSVLLFCPVTPIAVMCPPNRQTLVFAWCA